MDPDNTKCSSSLVVDLPFHVIRDSGHCWASMWVGNAKWQVLWTSLWQVCVSTCFMKRCETGTMPYSSVQAPDHRTGSCMWIKYCVMHNLFFPLFLPTIGLISCPAWRMAAEHSQSCSEERSFCLELFKFPVLEGRRVPGTVWLSKGFWWDSI